MRSPLQLPLHPTVIGGTPSSSPSTHVSVSESVRSRGRSSAKHDRGHSTATKLRRRSVKQIIIWHCNNDACELVTSALVYSLFNKLQPHKNRHFGHYYYYYYHYYYYYYYYYYSNKLTETRKFTQDQIKRS